MKNILVAASDVAMRENVRRCLHIADYPLNR